VPKETSTHAVLTARQDDASGARWQFHYAHVRDHTAVPDHCGLVRLPARISYDRPYHHVQERSTTRHCGTGTESSTLGTDRARPCLGQQTHSVSTVGRLGRELLRDDLSALDRVRAQ
jgi:hypothetical protein